MSKTFDYTYSMRDLIRSSSKGYSFLLACNEVESLTNDIFKYIINRYPRLIDDIYLLLRSLLEENPQHYEIINELLALQPTPLLKKLIHFQTAQDEANNLSFKLQFNCYFSELTQILISKQNLIIEFVNLNNFSKIISYKVTYNPQMGYFKKLKSFLPTSLS